MIQQHTSTLQALAEHAIQHGAAHVAEGRMEVCVRHEHVVVARGILQAYRSLHMWLLPEASYKHIVHYNAAITDKVQSGVA
jgi:hypothetical protein